MQGSKSLKLQRAGGFRHVCTAAAGGHPGGDASVGREAPNQVQQAGMAGNLFTIQRCSHRPFMMSYSLNGLREAHSSILDQTAVQQHPWWHTAPIGGGRPPAASGTTMLLHSPLLAGREAEGQDGHVPSGQDLEVACTQEVERICSWRGAHSGQCVWPLKCLAQLPAAEVWWPNPLDTAKRQCGQPVASSRDLRWS